MRKAKYYQSLLMAFKSACEGDHLDAFLAGILTPSELSQLAVRLEIVKRLKRGQTQREIADDLKVGIATVTRGSRELGKGRFNTI